MTNPERRDLEVDAGARDEDGTDGATKVKALVGLVVALLVGVAGWVGLSRATDRGIARLAAIDRSRGTCEISWRAARSRPETLMVDRIALADTIDPRSDQALMQCGDLRDKGSGAGMPNAREMSGEPMPQGLR
jgi:hypothetical protein